MANRNFFKDYSKVYPLIFTIIFIVVLFQYKFATLEAVLYDARVRFDLGMTKTDRIVLITLDEESDEFLGEKYPYTYGSHKKLIERIVKDSPVVVNYFVSLLEPETDSDVSNHQDFKETILSFQNQNGQFRFGTNMDAWGEHLPPIELREVGYSLGIVNVDNSIFAKDDVSRRALLNISGEDSIHLWTAKRYKRLVEASNLDINSLLGAYYVREADATFSLFRYSASTVEKDKEIKTIPFHKVVVGNFPKGFFKDKIVLVGPSYISNSSDYVLTPFAKEEYHSPKLWVHAQVIESLIQDKTAYQVPLKYSFVISVILALFLSFIVSQVSPTRGLFITLMVLAGVFAISFLLFWLMGLWVYIAHIILTVFIVYYIWVPFRAIGEYQTRFALQEEAKLIKKVENLKQNFISLMSHDLKTPVAKIAGVADILLQKNQNDPDLSRSLRSIIDSTKELNKFITSILDLTKIESRNISLRKTSKDINTIIEQVVDGLKFEASAKSISVVQEFAPLYPIEIDVDLIKRVISNLVENAIKYSGEGSEVSIKTADDDEWVYIEITDNGVGIAPQDLEHIFEKFYRVKNDASHQIKGTGLGLYLVKYFVELHGGSISAESEINKGTRFKIKLVNA